MQGDEGVNVTRFRRGRATTTSWVFDLLMGQPSVYATNLLGVTFHIPSEF